jgi:Fic family protein
MLYMPATDTYAMTPFFPEKGENELHALILELKEEAGRLSAAMHPVTAAAVSRLVVNMNSYYSNLIEGQYTHPVDIEKALKKDYSTDEKKRILQMESEAHVHVNEAMRTRLAERPAIDICSADFLCWLHGEFYEHLPHSLRTVRTDMGEEWEVVPGQLRTRDVAVGDHVAPASDAIGGFMERFEANYTPHEVKDPVMRILAIAASHHRLAWIHPFLDGNGRVTRLFSEAYFIKEGLGANGLWSISRGLAFFKKEYYDRLHNADMRRISDYDGRGNLSDTYLMEFCLFFLRTAIDQVRFMSSLFDIDAMLGRIGEFTGLMSARGEMRPESKYLLEEVFLRGRVNKSEIMHITGKSETIARPIMNDLLAKGLLKTGEEFRAPLTMNFPIKYTPYLFPKLYPPDVEATLI